MALGTWQTMKNIRSVKMDINIVWNTSKSGVITRLAIALQKETGWSLSSRPRDTADLNYFMLYIMIGQTPYDKTKTAAWFSHFELNRPNKQEWFNTAAARVDLRLTSARLYVPMLEVFGETALVEYPPIDPQFIDKPVIGVSGYVHPGGRKGERLLKWLLDSGDFDDCVFVASGKGWPIDYVREYTWGEMPDFYRHIDVFLCTSSVEGIPMPPLEALAMGKPVVIPKGVGLLDDLYHLFDDAIYYYDLDNKHSLHNALKKALSPIEARKSIVDMYTAKQWAKQHVQAFEAFLGVAKKKDTAPMGTVSEIASEVDATFRSVTASLVVADTEVMKAAAQEEIKAVLYNVVSQSEMELQQAIIKEVGGVSPLEELIPIENACVVFIAYGEPARECVQVAINSWHKWNTEPVIVISDDPPILMNDGDIAIYHPDDDIGARSIKTRLLDIVPDGWEYILYLDADTEIVANVQFLFQCLVDGWDIVACMNPAQYTTLESGLRPDNQADLDLTYEVTNGLGNYLQPNGGVMGIHRNERTDQFFETWHSEWQVFAARDQMAMFRALWQCSIKLYLLGQEWNTITRYNDASMSAGILHHPMRARRWRGIINDRLDSTEAWAQVHPKDNEDET